MPVRSGMSEQRIWSSVVREAETQADVLLKIYVYVLFGFYEEVPSALESVYFKFSELSEQGNLRREGD